MNITPLAWLLLGCTVVTLIGATVEMALAPGQQRWMVACLVTVVIGSIASLATAVT
jgi:hypothetical protein